MASSVEKIRKKIPLVEEKNVYWKEMYLLR